MSPLALPIPASGTITARPEFLSAAVPWQVGRYYSPQTSLGGAVAIGSGLSSGDVALCPFYCPRAARIDQIAVPISSGAAVGALIRVALYSMGSDGYPYQLLAQGEVDASSGAGLKALAVDVTLQAKTWYWLAYTASSNVPAGYNVPMDRWPTLFSTTTGSAFTPQSATKTGFTYGAFPSPFGPTVSTSSCRLIVVRCAEVFA